MELSNFTSMTVGSSLHWSALRTLHIEPPAPCSIAGSLRTSDGGRRRTARTAHVGLDAATGRPRSAPSHSDTTATILHEAASKLIQEHAQNLQNDLLRLQERAQQWQQRTHETMTAMTTHRPSNNDDNKDSKDGVSINDHKKDN